MNEQWSLSSWFLGNLYKQFLAFCGVDSAIWQSYQEVIVRSMILSIVVVDFQVCSSTSGADDVSFQVCRRFRFLEIETQSPPGLSVFDVSSWSSCVSEAAFFFVFVLFKHLPIFHVCRRLFFAVCLEQHLSFLFKSSRRRCSNLFLQNVKKDDKEAKIFFP